MTMVWVVYDISDNTTRKNVARICLDKAHIQEVMLYPFDFC